MALYRRHPGERVEQTVNRPRPFLVAIVGGSGAGKSWLAQELQARWVGAAARICLDDFYRDRSHLSGATCARVNFDHPRSVDWTLFERVLRDCREGREVALPRYDFSRHARLPKWEWWQPRTLVLVDGLWLLRRRRIRRLFDLTIFVECAAELRLRRRLQRDTQERGREAEAIRTQFRQQVEPMHARHVGPQKEWADLVVRSPLGHRAMDRLGQAIADRCRERLGVLEQTKH